MKEEKERESKGNNQKVDAKNKVGREEKEEWREKGRSEEGKG